MLAVNLPLLTMLRVVGGCVVGSLIRAAYFLLTKQLDLSAAYALSVLGLFAHPVRLLKAGAAGPRPRRGLQRGPHVHPARAHPLQGRGEDRRADLERAAAGLRRPPPGDREESEEDEQFVDQQSLVRRIIGHPGVQLFAALLLIALVAERRLLGASPLGGGALVPAWGGAPALWQEYLAGFHAVSMGSSASAPPYLAVVAALGTVLGGQAWLAVDVLLLGCVPLAGLTAYLATPLARDRDPGPGAARGVVRAAARRHRRRGRRAAWHRGRLRPAAAHRGQRRAGCSPRCPGRRTARPGRPGC